MSYVVYLKGQLEVDPTLLDIEELVPLIQVITSQGMRNPFSEPVHFPKAYGNQVDLAQELSGKEKCLLMYISSHSSWVVPVTLFAVQFCS